MLHEASGNLRQLLLQCRTVETGAGDRLPGSIPVGVGQGTRVLGTHLALDAVLDNINLDGNLPAIQRSSRSSVTFVLISVALIVWAPFQLVWIERLRRRGVLRLSVFSVRPNFQYSVLLLCGGLDSIIHLRRGLGPSLVSRSDTIILRSTVFVNCQNIQCLPYKFGEFYTVYRLYNVL